MRVHPKFLTVRTPLCLGSVLYVLSDRPFCFAPALREVLKLSEEEACRAGYALRLRPGRADYQPIGIRPGPRGLFTPPGICAGCV